MKEVEKTVTDEATTSHILCRSKVIANIKEGRVAKKTLNYGVKFRFNNSSVNAACHAKCFMFCRKCTILLVVYSTWLTSEV